MNYAAYEAEVHRGALAALPSGQARGPRARRLVAGSFASAVDVLLPQSARIRGARDAPNDFVGCSGSCCQREVNRVELTRAMTIVAGASAPMGWCRPFGRELVLRDELPLSRRSRGSRKGYQKIMKSGLWAAQRPCRYAGMVGRTPVDRRQIRRAARRSKARVRARCSVFGNGLAKRRPRHTGESRASKLRRRSTGSFWMQAVRGKMGCVPRVSTCLQHDECATNVTLDTADCQRGRALPGGGARSERWTQGRRYERGRKACRARSRAAKGTPRATRGAMEQACSACCSWTTDRTRSTQSGGERKRCVRLLAATTVARRAAHGTSAGLGARACDSARGRTEHALSHEVAYGD